LQPCRLPLQRLTRRTPITPTTPGRRLRGLPFLFLGHYQRSIRHRPQFLPHGLLPYGSMPPTFPQTPAIYYLAAQTLLILDGRVRAMSLLLPYPAPATHPTFDDATYTTYSTFCCPVLFCWRPVLRWTATAPLCGTRVATLAFYGPHVTLFLTSPSRYGDALRCCWFMPFGWFVHAAAHRLTVGGPRDYTLPSSVDDVPVYGSVTRGCPLYPSARTVALRFVLPNACCRARTRFFAFNIRAARLPPFPDQPAACDACSPGALPPITTLYRR